MPPAKRKNRKPSASLKRGLSHGFGMLVVGMIIGSLATLLGQGVWLGDRGTGSGIRKVVEQSLQQSEEQDQAVSGAPVEQVDKPQEQPISFDFFTVLPEIEMVVPDNRSSTPAPPPSSLSPSSGVTAEKSVSSTTPRVASKKSAYMLQAGSYRKKPDADRLKAQLALWGHASRIQKVTIQGRGDFYRVRLGPWSGYDEMVAVDKSLISFGIKTLRLKVSGG